MNSASGDVSIERTTLKSDATTWMGRENISKSDQKSESREGTVPLARRDLEKRIFFKSPPLY